MPSRNALKDDVAESYYHVYARGANKDILFIEQADYLYFLKLLQRYLASKEAESKAGYVYPKYSDQIELLAFCLMNNHFHILIYQKEQGSMTAFMRSLMTSYSKYFNLKYKRTGPLFETRYKAVRIGTQSYLEHITRYIHLNPRYWRRYPYSSLPYYLGAENVEWVRPGKIMDLFASKDAYVTFLADYEDNRNMLSEIKHQLADS